MKLIYQQMLAFFVVIITLLVILGVSFFHLMKENVYKTTWSQMESYAYSLKNSSMTLQSTNSGQKLVLDNVKLQTSETLLQNQEVHFTIYTGRKKIIYPSNGFKSTISKSDWKKLKQGEILKRRKDVGGRKISVKNKKLSSYFKNKMQSSNKNKRLPEIQKQQQQVTTDVFVPCFDSSGNLVAVISVGAMVSSVESNLQDIQKSLLYALLISALLGIFVSYILAHYTTKRISRLRGAVHQIAEGNFDVKIENNGRDELDYLAGDFNQMTDSLKESREEIKRQEDRRRQFMADAAHEMRTPLTTVNGLLEGLAYDAIPEESKGKSIELMRNETNRLIRLVNENLDYEKIRSGAITLSKSKFDAVQVIKNIVQQLTKKAKEVGDEFELNIPKELSVYADYDRFVQVVFNITQNAIQFTQNGKIGISAERGYHETIIRISDTGIGMSKEQLRNIWERYYKADPSRNNTKYGESGLGLSIVHQLMQLHKGKIEVTSQEGQGTTFILTFPDEEVSEV
ncbi:HAMP domain-containing histidine kinase [Ligilactobacillus sp. WILCCON 0076]|uniref:histidine kinase n=1 Tax=Ligilactobacillus ubinensis TaxID=2876789 RepID=A0A9X2FIS5_9LACO|nr:HAMP domain-containing sensor histidine kinase [Ligilactobacillus ubinensis]MCP0886295.1 HAMP domain-containing histidine kinase [Ligilactobacillus ubinensis]